MEVWLLLILLGIITYFIVKLSVASITRTPIWILWLVLMTPAIIWSSWTLVYGQKAPMPSGLILVPFVVCSVAYWLLIHWGRKVPNPPSDNPTNASIQNLDTPKIAAETEGSTVRPIDKAEETNLRSCFPWAIYYLENVEYRPQAVLCRGKLRTNPDVAYQTIRDNIEAQFGDRFLVIFQNSFSGKPFFALVPNPHAQEAAKKRHEQIMRPGLALLLLGITLFTTTIIGAGVSNISAKQVHADPSVLLQGLPYALALMVILGIHELGHYLTARFYQIRTTLPYFIPLPPFIFPGTFGAFIQMRSPVPNRKALFDVSIAGPVAGFVITLPLLIWGLAHSSVVPLTDKAGLLNIDALNPRFSLFLTLLAKLALGSAFTAKMAIDLHPVAIAGYIGLLVTALNLMPVWQLDGGHIVHAMFGQRTSAIVGQITRLLVIGLSFIHRDLFLWALILLLMPSTDEPALNDVSELDNWRDLWGLLALGLLVSILLPVSGGLIRLLHV